MSFWNLKASFAFRLPVAVSFLHTSSKKGLMQKEVGQPVTATPQEHAGPSWRDRVVQRNGDLDMRTCGCNPVGGWNRWPARSRPCRNEPPLPSAHPFASARSAPTPWPREQLTSKHVIRQHLSVPNPLRNRYLPQCSMVQQS